MPLGKKKANLEHTLQKLLPKVAIKSLIFTKTFSIRMMSSLSDLSFRSQNFLHGKNNQMKHSIQFS